LQYRVSLAGGDEQSFRFAFGPARTENDIAKIRQRYLTADGFESALCDYQSYMQQGKGCLQIKTPDADFDNFVNHWLGRQMFYHGDVNRMTTDPQTRNYLQDAMGMVYIRPSSSRAAFLHALSQQAASGEMPDGILLHEQAELKYINQVPHSDHCVWLPVCLQAYLDESGDDELLDTIVSGSTDGLELSVFERISRAMQWLIDDRDERGLSYIAQGDWCDPMNMVGLKGKGVSAWLSIATVYALKCWANVAEQVDNQAMAARMQKSADDIQKAVQRHLWDGQWFARGITDDDVLFGVSTDTEGRIFLNPQSWAMLAGIATDEQVARMTQAIEEHLEGPHGVAVLAPAYTKMRSDIGRLTQKHPGVTENGSVYNHAAAFYIFALFANQQDPERAYRLLRQMIPGPSEQDQLQRGQLPVFIPNHYRGDWRNSPRTAGRSSQLFNTGTVAWVYRILVDGLFGVKGSAQGLNIKPQLPADWPEAFIRRTFRGAHFNIRMTRRPDGKPMSVRVDGQWLAGTLISDFEAGRSYEVDVLL